MHLPLLVSLSMTAKFLLLLVVVSTVLSGCSSTSLVEPIGTINSASQGITQAELKNDVLVFGRIRWIQNDEERTDYHSAYGWNIWPKYFRIEDESNGTLGVDNDGRFAWQLPKGTYIAYHLRWFDSWDGLHRLPLRLAFQVPKPQKAYCIGTISVNLTAKRDLIGGLWIKGWEIDLDDSCEQDSKWFQKHYPNLTIPIEPSPLVYDPDIPDNIQGLERKENMADFIRVIYPLFLPVEME